MTESIDTSNSGDILDSLIYVSIVLFILSAITEKITQLVRHYPRQFQIIALSLILIFYGLIFFSFLTPADSSKTLETLDFSVLLGVNTFFLALFILNLSGIKRKANALGVFAARVAVLQNIEKGNPSVDDDTKAREVSTLSFIIGFIITYLFNANLIELFANPSKQMGWDISPFLPNSVQLNPDFFGFDVGMAIGFVVTGFFLSFGSMFFHDLLDTLLQIKNLKRKLNEDATFDAETIEQFDEHLAKSSSAIIETAISQNQKLFKDELLIGPPLHGRMFKNGRMVDSVDVHLKGKDRGGIPVYLEAKLERGQVVKVPTNVIYEVEPAKVFSDQGNAVASSATPNFKGTICCQIENLEGKQFLLTCSHVLNNGSSKNNFGALAPKVPALVDAQAVGNFTWALCNDKFDIALLEANDTFGYTLIPKATKVLNSTDILTTRIRVVRQNKNVDDGVIVNHCSSKAISIGYRDGDFGMLDLIVLSKISVDGDDIHYTGITIPGDSGAAVYDEQNNLIGMVIAGNNKFSYAISLPSILTKLKATLKK